MEFARSSRSDQSLTWMLVMGRDQHGLRVAALHGDRDEAHDDATRPCHGDRCIWGQQG